MVTASVVTESRNGSPHHIVEVPSRLPNGYEGWVGLDADGYAIPHQTMELGVTIGHTEQGFSLAVAYTLDPSRQA